MTGRDGKFDVQLLSECGKTLNCLSRSVPETHQHVTWTLSSQQTIVSAVVVGVEGGGSGLGMVEIQMFLFLSSSRLSDGNSSLLNEGGRASQVPQASVELAGYGSVVWPDSLSEWLVDGARPQ